MSDYNAKINQKGCDKTGVTEDLAAELYNGGRSTMIAIVDLSVATSIDDHETGKKTVTLKIDSIEPVIDGNLNGKGEDMIRRVQRALHMNRRMIGGDQTLPNDPEEPNVADVLKATEALVETDENGDVAGLWDGKTDTDEPTDEAEHAGETPEADEDPEPDPEPEDQADTNNVTPIGSPAFSGA